MLDISKRLFSNLNQRNIRYCHWKSNEHLTEGLKGLTDLDLLVSPEDKMNCEHILRDLDFIQCKPQYGARYSGVEDWLGYDIKTGKLIHIHLHYEMITGHRGVKEYTLPWSQEALDTRILEESTGVYIIDPNLEMMTLYTRIALKASFKKIYAGLMGKHKLDQGSLKEITYLKQRINLSLMGALVQKYFGSERLLKEFMEKEFLTSHDFLSLYGYVKKQMKPYRPWNAFGLFIKKGTFALALVTRAFLKYKVNSLMIYKKTPQRGGLIVAFVGQDGSGKSTVTKEILEWLTWKLEAHKFYLGSGEHYRSWQKDLKKKIEAQKKYKLVALLSAWLTLSNHLSVAKRTYKVIKKGKRYAINGGIALFDRYPQTAYFGINDGPKIRFNYLERTRNPLLRKYVLYCAKLEEKYLAKAEKVVPDIVFKLILPPEISIQRKPGEDYKSVIRKHDIIKTLSYEHSKTYRIDANNIYTEEIKEIKELLWSNLLNQESLS